MRGLPTWSKRRYARYWADRATEPGTITYVALGDSAAQGIGATRPELGYVGLLANSIGELSGVKVRVINLSVSGAKIADVIADQLPALTAIDADIVTVDIGGNDIRRFDHDEFAGRVDTLLAGLPEGAIVADVPCFYGGRSEKRALVAARLIQEMGAQRGLQIAPLHRATEARRDAQARHDFALDLFHPNDSGYRVWASAFSDLVLARVRSLQQ